MLTSFLAGALLGGATVHAYCHFSRCAKDARTDASRLPSFDDIISASSGNEQIAVRQANKQTTTAPLSPASATMPTDPSCSPEENERPDLSELFSVARRIEDEMLQALVIDRLTTHLHALELTLPEWGVEAISIREEWNKLLPRYSSPDSDSLRQLLLALQRVMEKHGFEILHGQTWDPDIQRASIVHRTAAPDTEPMITNFISDGLRYRGDLIRKQEVELTISEKS